MKIFIKKNFKNLISLFFAALALMGTILYFDLPHNNVLYIIALYILFSLIRKRLNKIDKKRSIVAYILALLNSIILNYGIQLDKYSAINHGLRTCFTIVAFSILLFLIIYKIIELLDDIKIEDNVEKISRKQKLVTFFGIFICYFIIYLAIFPGVYGYDSGYQFMMFNVQGIQLTTHFSLLFSYLFYFIVNLGHTMTNSYEIGFGLYSFIQMTFIVFTEYKVCMYILEKFQNKNMWITSILFFMLTPMNMILALSSCQDVVFSGIFALLIVMTLKMIDNGKAFWSRWQNPVLYSLLLFLLFAFRNNGIYAFIFVIITTLIFLRENRFKFLIVFLIPLILFKIYTGPIFEVWNVKDTDSLKEMSSAVVQQFGRVYYYNRQSLNEEEKEYMTQLVPEEDLEIYEYNPCISDALKVHFNSDLLKSDYKKFVDIYISVGMKNKTAYIDAVLLNSIGTWYPNKNYPEPRMYHPLEEYNMLDAKFYNENYTVIERKSLLPHLEKVVNYFFGTHRWSKIPIVSNVYSPGTYFVTYIFVVIYSIYKKKIKYLIPLSFILGLYITVILAPVSLYRYIYPVILSAPAWISIVFDKREKS